MPTVCCSDPIPAPIHPRFCRQLRQAGVVGVAASVGAAATLPAQSMEQSKKKWKFLQVQSVSLMCVCLHHSVFASQAAYEVAESECSRWRTAHVQTACLYLLQKYWHKGAFFQAEDAEGESVLGDIMHRDYDGATGEDKVDRQMLPKIMQVRLQGPADPFISNGGMHGQLEGPRRGFFLLVTLCRSGTLAGGGARSGRTCSQKIPACRLRMRQVLLVAGAQPHKALRNHAP